MSASKKVKTIDWFSRITLTAFLFVVVSGGILAFNAYDDYKSAFGGTAYPPSVAARIKADAENKPEIPSTAIDRAGQARSEWGQFGDFLGGTLNPIFGFVSVIALFLTILYQSRELKLSTEELQKSAEALEAQNITIEHQRFEQTFFSWLTAYRELLGSLEQVERRRTRSGDEVVMEYRGRTALKYWYDTYIDNYAFFDSVKAAISGDEWVRSGVDSVKGSSGDRLLHLAANGLGIAVTKVAQTKWAELYKVEEFQLDSLFRVLYRLIKWIDEQPTGRVLREEKWFYVGIVRSQLSWIEMVFLYFNGMTDRGKNFKLYIDRYALFDNLPIEGAPLLSVLRDWPIDTDGYAKGAFSSDIARQIH